MGDAGTVARSGVAAVSVHTVPVTTPHSMAKPSANALVVAYHLSPLVEAAIRLLPGNDRCADCKSIYPQWAGVSFGVLLCLACAGRHRALGVSVSFVKSLAMDTWSPTEQRALEVGGNAKWIAVCTGSSTFDLPIAHKYTTSVAKAYKQRVLLIANAETPTSDSFTANEFLTQLMVTVATPASPVEEPSQRASNLEDASPPSASSTSGPTRIASSVTATTNGTTSTEMESRPSRSYSTDLQIKCTTCKDEISLHEIDSHSKRCVVRSTSSVAWRKYDCTFGRVGESLGVSLTKTKGGFAEVTRVAPNGDAAQANVLVGSYVVGLNSVKTSVFDEIVALVSTLERPIHFHFVIRSSHHSFRTSSTSGSSSANASRCEPHTRHLPALLPAPISSVPEPVSVEIEAIFDEHVMEIGCVLQVQYNRCVVKHVDAGSAAARQGVLVGSSVAAVNGRLVVRASEAIEAIQKSSRPLRIKFHRVEGLMRGWKSSS